MSRAAIWAPGGKQIYEAGHMKLAVGGGKRSSSPAVTCRSKSSSRAASPKPKKKGGSTKSSRAATPQASRSSTPQASSRPTGGAATSRAEDNPSSSGSPTSKSDEASNESSASAKPEDPKRQGLGLKWVEVAVGLRPSSGAEFTNDRLSELLSQGRTDFTLEDLTTFEVELRGLEWSSYIQAAKPNPKASSRWFKPARADIEPAKVNSKLSALFAAQTAAKKLAKEAREAKRRADEAEAKAAWLKDAAKWIGAGDLASVVLNALKMPREEGETVAFDYMRGLDRTTVEHLLGEAQLSGLVEHVMGGLNALEKQAAPSGGALNEKFQETGKFTMGYGNLSHFFNGLETLLGPPAMVKDEEGVATILMGMQVEHTLEKDCSDFFTSSNGVTTTSQIEWDFAYRPTERVYLREEEEWPERKGFKDAHPNWCREYRSLDDLMELLEVKANSKLRAEGHSELIKEELLGGRLYTGPVRKLGLEP